jgi:hypothetical protein
MQANKDDMSPLLHFVDIPRVMNMFVFACKATLGLEF